MYTTVKERRRFHEKQSNWCDYSDARYHWSNQLGTNRVFRFQSGFRGFWQHDMGFPHYLRTCGTGRFIFNQLLWKSGRRRCLKKTDDRTIKSAIRFLWYYSTPFSNLCSWKEYAGSAIYGICRPIMQTLCHVSRIVRNLCGMTVTLTKIYFFAASYFSFRHF